MQSIRTKLIVGLVGAVVGVALLAGGALWLVVRARVTEDFDAAMSAKGRAMAAMVRREKGKTIRVDFADEMMGEFTTKKRPEYFEVRDWDGRLVEASPSLEGKELTRTEGDGVHDVTLPDGKEGRQVSTSFVPEAADEADENGPKVTLVLAQRTKSIERTMELVGWGLTLAAAIMAAGAAGAVWVLVDKGLRPLEGVAEQAGRIDAGNLSARFGTDVPVELRPIVIRLNELLERLEGAFARERRFTAAAAHELRTPIAELRAMAEVAIRWPGADGNQGMPEVLAVARNMESLAGSLLALSRCESGQERARSEAVDLERAVARAWEGVAGRAAGHGVRLKVECAGGGVVRGDPAMVEAIARNLLENAVEYSPVDGGVECRVGGNRLVVVNRQEGLGAEDLAHVFEPFWRKDKARSGGVHAGLGLALVRAYAEAMGGTASAGVGAGDVFRVEVEFGGVMEGSSSLHTVGAVEV